MTSLHLFPEIKPYHHAQLQVDDIHYIYFEQCGNPTGLPVIFLHGGPGSGCNPNQRRFFDPAVYRIILFDQRGCGRSTPAGEITNNTTAHLVSDIETIRQHLNLDTWHVFGGSWGSTLALAYATEYPDKVKSLVLRGIFLSRRHEIEWFLGQVSLFFPEAWEKLLSYPADTGQWEKVLSAYATQIFNQNITISIPAAIRWNAFESSIICLIPKSVNDTGPDDGNIELARARVQIHYIKHLCFVDGDTLLKKAGEKLRDKPITIVQGRYDMVCPPKTAWELQQKLPHAKFEIIADAGHSAMETGTYQALIRATEAYKHL